MIVVIEKICIERNIDYREIKSKEILALKQENVSEDDYLTALYVYVEYLKEVMGAYLSEEIWYRKYHVFLFYTMFLKKIINYVNINI